MNVENVNIETLNKKIEDLSNTIRNLRHANLLYQKVLDKLPLGLNLSDGNGNPLIVNQIYQSIKENYFINDSNIQSLQNDYYVQSSTNILNQRVDDENSYEHEFTIYPKTNTLNQLSDNETRVIDEIVTSMQMPGVKNNYQLSVLFDVTEIKEKNNLINAQIKDYQLINQKLEKAFDKVKKSEAQFRMLIEKAPGPIFILIEQKFEYLNQAAVHLYGAQSAQQLIGTHISSRIHPDDSIQALEHLSSSANRNIDTHIHEFRHIRIDHSVIDVEVSSVPVQFNKKPAILVFVNDITARKKADEKIKEQQLLFETMFNTLTDGVVITDIERNILLANRGVKITFGYEPDELIGKSARILYADQEKYEKAGLEIYNEHTLSPGILYQTRYRHKNNSIFPGETFGAKLYNTNGTWIGNLAIMRNISDRLNYINDLKYTKAKAEESDRLKTAFLHNISHEIRTPMNAIIGFSELLNNPRLTAEKRRYFTDMISQGSNQLLSIINDIITISAIEAGQEQIYESKTGLNSLLKTLFNHHLIKAQKMGIDFKYSKHFDDNSDFIETDKSKLETIFNCLINNALKFTHHGSVEFGYKLENRTLFCFVKDTGIGIEDSYQQVIFEPFRQVETSSTRTYSGSGLGLSIAKAYTSLLGGKIWVESEPGNGSCFYFTIPYKKAVSDFKNIPVPEQKIDYNNSTHILIAEDEDSNYMVLEEWLSELSIENTRAYNGFEAVKLCHENKAIRVVLMDIKMPVMDGIEATKKIKQFDPTITIIAQTAYSFSEEKHLALNAGCDYFITKPINKTELLRIINSVYDKMAQKQ